MIPTGLYIRFSGRRHGISIPDQLARLRAEAHTAGEMIVAEYIDQARTGNNTRRKEYQRMLTDAKAGLFHRIRVESVDRGHRNDFDRRAFEYEMQRYGVQVVYSGEPERQAPPFRKLHRGIRGVVAEFESDEASDRTYKRHLYRAKKGLWRGGSWPYGLKSDGTGWLMPDPVSYPVLLWILEQRAQGVGHHTIAKTLNHGISIDGESHHVPPTPGLLAYQRRPYVEHQDPETGETTRLPRQAPSSQWTVWTVQRLCRATIDGIYAGIYHWGHRYNRFTEYGDGRTKEPLRIDTGKPLVPADLLRRVQAVELMAMRAPPQTQAAHNRFLLHLICGRGKQPMHEQRERLLERLERFWFLPARWV
jgi:DNA invertase Pin-like site-specific DNA recombinase